MCEDDTQTGLVLTGVLRLCTHHRQQGMVANGGWAIPRKDPEEALAAQLFLGTGRLPAEISAHTVIGGMYHSSSINMSPETGKQRSRCIRFASTDDVLKVQG